MSVANRLTAVARRVAATAGATLTSWSGEGEQTPAAQSGHLDTEDPALFTPRVYGDPAKLHVASTAVVNDALFNLSSGEITIGEWAFFGHGVSVLTGTHDWRTFGKVRQTAVPKTGRDVVIEEGVWVSSGATVVGPCRIGANAVVAVGAVVLGDVDALHDRRRRAGQGHPDDPARRGGRGRRGCRGGRRVSGTDVAAQVQALETRVAALEAEVAALRARARSPSTAPVPGSPRSTPRFADRFRGSVTR